MRNPERIDTFCEELKKAWHKVPDWRFGQMMSNFLGFASQQNRGMDIFFLEDPEMLKALKEYFKMEEK